MKYRRPTNLKMVLFLAVMAWMGVPGMASASLVIEEPGVICNGGLKGTRYTEKEEQTGKVLQIQCVPDGPDGQPVIELSEQQKYHVIKEQAPDCAKGQRRVWMDRAGKQIQKPGNDVNVTEEGITTTCQDIPIPPRTLDTKNEQDSVLLQKLPFETHAWDRRNGGWQLGIGADLLFMAYCGSTPSTNTLCPASRSRYLASVHLHLAERWSAVLEAGMVMNNLYGAYDPGFYGALLARAKLSHFAHSHLRFGAYVEAMGNQNNINMGKDRGMGTTQSHVSVGLNSAFEFAPYKRAALQIGIDLNIYDTGNDQTRATMALPDWGKPVVLVKIGGRFFLL